jgi:hypothetical protein
MRVTSITNQGQVRSIIYDRKKKDWFFENGFRVPERLREGFRSTIFLAPNERKEIEQSKLDAQVAYFQDRLKKGLLKKPDPTQKPDSSND